MNTFLNLIAFFLITSKASAAGVGSHLSSNSPWAKCNVQNGRIFMEKYCKRLLLCYQSNLITANSKVGRGFVVKKSDNLKRNFTECAEVMKGKIWHGLIIAQDDYGTTRNESSNGIDQLLDLELINETENHSEILLKKVFSSNLNEFQNASNFGAFLADYDWMVQPFFAGKLFSSCAQNGTMLCQTKCIFDPTAWTEEQFGTEFMKIAFPVAKVSKFVLHIWAIPYRIACSKYAKPMEMFEKNPPPTQGHRHFDGCMKVPTTKCHDHEQLIACYNSSKKLHGNNSIVEMCQKHFGEIAGANYAGFIVKICAHRKQNSIILNSTINFSILNKTFNRMYTLPFSLEKIFNLSETLTIFLIEFGEDEQQSAIREKADAQKMNEKNDGVGTVFNDIAPQMINGTIAKLLHFVPPSSDFKMPVFFQIEDPEFSKRITSSDHSLSPSENDPKMWRKSAKCDTYGKDCYRVTGLLKKLEALIGCKRMKRASSNDQIGCGIGADEIVVIPLS